jgi:hypothetical protein
MSDEAAELVGAKAEQLAVATGHHCGAPAAGGQERHFTEELTGTQFGDEPTAGRRRGVHAQSTGHDHEGLIRRLIGVNDGLAAPHERALTRADDFGERGSRERAEWCRGREKGDEI